MRMSHSLAIKNSDNFDDTENKLRHIIVQSNSHSLNVAIVGPNTTVSNLPAHVVSYTIHLQYGGGA